MVLKTQPPKPLTGDAAADLGELRRVLTLLIAELSYMLEILAKGGDDTVS